ncbi:NADH-ubiquinone oxidoreductase chain J [hydrothermal vent metagenome]|uniref:NADH-ubiquinone oxidoreductase chain J n=1 Tax=hydrothermal vent metagenome TaxID=652676 RepID=A0A3B1D4C1_9ZZZZ
MVEWFFGYLAGAVILLSLLVVLSRNPVHSVLWMLLMFLHVAGLYLLLNAEFLAATQVIVYAGAILVLFLFVVMLLNLKEEIRFKRFTGGWPVRLLIAAGILIVLKKGFEGFKVGFKGPWSIEAIEQATHTKALGKVLFTEYVLPFEIASLILLVAIIGAVFLAKKRAQDVTGGR